MRTLTEERRQAILTAASQVFQELGYERTSMNEVARRVGGSKATLYNYFDSKEALFEAVVRTYSTQFLTLAAAELTREENKTRTLEARLTGFGVNMLQVLAGGHQALQIYRIVVGEAGHSDIGTLFRESGIRESMETLAQVMRDAVQNGELNEAEPMLLARQFTALVKAETDALLLQREIPHFTDTQINAMVQRGVQLFLLGASPRG